MPRKNQGILINAIQGFSTEMNNAIDAAPFGRSSFQRANTATPVGCRRAFHRNLPL
ncbi:uncharacterized protein METZ01_LOCUS321447, partial [marine metagenome]